VENIDRFSSSTAGKERDSDISPFFQVITLQRAGEAFSLN